MVFIDNISELQYYQGEPCYCELVLEPSDISLQASFELGAVGATYTISIHQYSADGVTMLNDVTSAFDWVVYEEGGLSFANIRLANFTNDFCSEPCFILKVVVTRTQGGINKTVFDKYTEQYCLDSCCYGQIGGIEVRAGASDGQIIYSGNGS